MKKLIATLVLGATALGLSSSAYAVATLTLKDNVTLATVSVNGNAAGVASYNGAVGAGVWSVNVATGLTQPLLSPVPSMDLNSVDFSTGAGSLTITWTDTFTVSQLTGLFAEIGGTQSNGTTSYSVTQGGGLPSLVGMSASTPFAFSSVVAAPAGTYTLTQSVTIVHTASGTTSFDASLSPVPDAGSTLLLLGAALAVVGLVGRRKSAI